MSNASMSQEDEDHVFGKDNATTRTIPTPGGFIRATGTEARVCELIARRQQMGVAKYGTTVVDNPLSLRQWLTHALEESLDFSIYIQRTLEEMDRLEDDQNGK